LTVPFGIACLLLLAHDPEKACPHLMRGVQRFSEKITRKLQRKKDADAFSRVPRHKRLPIVCSISE